MWLFLTLPEVKHRWQLTWSDGADHHRLLAARHETKTQDRISPHLHQSRGGGEPIQVNFLQGAAGGHLAGKTQEKKKTHNDFILDSTSENDPLRIKI